ncbi:hypothetical protein NUU61_007394 [Penicillium alfredii]|uniref:C2H2-type domain-containing protein n=1 Tax=Penicillium alfredii TaxID=1506179 RepID=A0A9W9F2U1_9EURO|nr:uncharacterized protein NUU61_007394 [Penicillium alfredii]KAJ5092524.1 hypothetical protein NUU61_007394 [Penicillium alfredii]
MDLASLLSHGAPGPKAYAPYTPKESGPYKRSPQPPLSPPVDEPKCSLPSISTLLEGADGAQHAAKRQRLSPTSHRERDTRHSYDSVCLPPTPPLRPGSGSGHSAATSPTDLSSSKPDSVRRLSSPGTTHMPAAAPYASPAPSVSSYSSPVDVTPSATAIYYGRPPATATFQPATQVPAAPMPQPHHQHQQRQHAHPAASRAPAPTQASGPTAPPQQQHHHQQQQPQQRTASASAPAPAQAPAPSSSSPAQISPVTPAWQHHHYFPPSSTAAYPQNHDRYICRTCHKAFSRPSSLRIHSHSHTGEKPFRCTHAGCGKAFSVRSNMKRHERGCHSGRPAAAALVV